MPSRDYYEILGVPRDATADQIKKAYRHLARRYHPDVNPGDKTAESKFKEAQQAYDILSEPEKRATYDRFGHAAFEAGAGAGPRGGASEWFAQGGPNVRVENIDLNDLLGNFTQGAQGGGGLFEDLISRMKGGRSSRQARGAEAGGGGGGARSGREIEAHLTIPFLTAVRGGETTIEIEREPGRRVALDVKIPPGIESGQKLRLKGQGSPGIGGGPAGALVVEIEVEPHKWFTREGRDLVVEVPVSLGEAILGGKIEVPTLDGIKTLNVPSNSTSGQKLRLKGQGVPASSGQPEGDLFVILKVALPRTTNDESKALIRQFMEQNPYRPREGLW